MLDKLTASFQGVREEVAGKAATRFDQAIKNLNEAIETAGKANREGVDKNATDKLDTALKAAKALEQAKPGKLETVTNIKAVFTRADQASKAAKTLSEAGKAVNDAAQAKTQAQQGKAQANTNQHMKAMATVAMITAVLATTTRTQAAMEALVVVRCAMVGNTATTQTSPNIAMTTTDGHTTRCNPTKTGN